MTIQIQDSAAEATKEATTVTQVKMTLKVIVDQILEANKVSAVEATLGEIKEEILVQKISEMRCL